MNKLIIVEVEKIAKKAEFSGSVTELAVKEIVVSLAKNHGQKFSEYLEEMYDYAVKSYTSTNGLGDKTYSRVSDCADEILLLLDIQTNYSDLYPTFELYRNGKHFCEYSVSNAIKQYNNFWNHW